MNFLEKDLEQIIYEATDEQLQDLQLYGIKKRQLRINGYGVADLVYFERIHRRIIDDDNRICKVHDVGLKITVCEFKKEQVGISAFLQAIGYCQGIRRYLESRGFEKFIFRILLLGKKVDITGNLIYLADLIQDEHDEFFDFEFNKSLKNVDFYSYKYGFDGLEFDSHYGYISSNDNFKKS